MMDRTPHPEMPAEGPDDPAYTERAGNEGEGTAAEDGDRGGDDAGAHTNTIGESSEQAYREEDRGDRLVDDDPVLSKLPGGDSRDPGDHPDADDGVPPDAHIGLP